MKHKISLLAAIGVILILLSALSSRLIVADQVLQATVSSTVFNYLPFVAKNWSPPPTPTPTKTPAPVICGEYEGMTDPEDRPIDLSVRANCSTVTRIRINMHFSCDGHTVDGTVQVSSQTGWAIQDQSFVAETRAFVVTGTFTSDFSAVNGTWQGIAHNLFTGQEFCRGDVFNWSATRQD